MHVAVPTAGYGTPGTAYYDYPDGWGSPNPGQMVCFEGASPFRDALNHQTQCGSDIGVDTSSGAQGYSLWGGIWGSQTCGGDSGGMVRFPSRTILGTVSYTYEDVGDPNCDGPQAFYAKFWQVRGYYYGPGGSPFELPYSLGPGSTRFQVEHSAQCLATVSDTTSPTQPIVQYPCTWGGTGSWQPFPVNRYPAGSGQSDEYFLIRAGVCADADIWDPHRVFQYWCAWSGNGLDPNATQQQWEFMSNGANGSFQIKNIRRGEMLEVAGLSTTPGAAAQTWPPNGLGNQRWHVTD